MRTSIVSKLERRTEGRKVQWIKVSPVRAEPLLALLTAVTEYVIGESRRYPSDICPQLRNLSQNPQPRHVIGSRKGRRDIPSKIFGELPSPNRSTLLSCSSLTYFRSIDLCFGSLNSLPPTISESMRNGEPKMHSGNIEMKWMSGRHRI